MISEIFNLESIVLLKDRKTNQLILTGEVSSKDLNPQRSEQTSKSKQKDFVYDEWQRWQIRHGLSRQSHLPVSQNGLFTDFV